MKKLVTLLLAAGLVISAVTPSSAVEVKPFGVIEFLFEGTHNMGALETAYEGKYAFMDNRDVRHNVNEPWHPQKTRFMQRFILGAGLVVSESLSAHIDFICGFFTWGGPDGGGAAIYGGRLGGRAVNAVTRQAYMDWIIPNTRAKVRMGLYAWFAPQYAVGTVNPFEGDEIGTGIQVSTPINDNVSVTLGWLRASSDSRRNTSATWAKSRHDLFDMFTLVVPVKLDGFAFTPWGAIGLLGRDATTYPNTVYEARPTPPAGYGSGTPEYTAYEKALKSWEDNAGPDNKWLPLRNAAIAGAQNAGRINFQRGKSFTYFAGVGGEATLWDPFRFAFDLGYSGIDTSHSYTDRSGWLIGASISYKTSYGVPTLKGWYTSGDDSNVNNGSERPIITGAFRGGALRSFGGSANGTMTTGLSVTAAGTWGISAQWNNVSFVDKLTHNFHVTYVAGTNNKHMARYADPRYVTDYLTTADSLVEFNFETLYSLYRNLTLGVELSYIMEDFSASTWSNEWVPGATGGSTLRTNQPRRFSDAAYVGMNLRYMF